MNLGREDLSEWALHFIHDRNPHNEPTDQDVDFSLYGSFPYHESEELNDRFDLWNISDDYYSTESDAGAFAVLSKIIIDGHIRGTWAFRNNRPTIYGPRAAVCFTEMPLYALIDYAKQRRADSVNTYAIGVLKRELFSAGGRPVIYGLTGKHAEQRPPQPNSGGWPRKLAPSTGIHESEQYRYVAMSTDPDRPIDWSHEREWRWADHRDQCTCPGLPIWLSDEPVSFSRVFVVVSNTNEAEQVLGVLKELYDSGANDFGHSFSKKALKDTSVISLEELESTLTDSQLRHLRIEDVPASHIDHFSQPMAPHTLVNKVRDVLDEAEQAANFAAAEYLKTAPRTVDGYVGDVAGWAHLVIYDAQTPLVSALLQLEETYSVPGVGYIVHRVGGLGWRQEQALSVAETAVEAAQAVFRKHFPDISFGVRTRWD